MKTAKKAEPETVSVKKPLKCFGGAGELAGLRKTPYEPTAAGLSGKGFVGIHSKNQLTASGFELEPPDQGLAEAARRN